VKSVKPTYKCAS